MIIEKFVFNNEFTIKEFKAKKGHFNSSSKEFVCSDWVQQQPWLPLWSS